MKYLSKFVLVFCLLLRIGLLAQITPPDPPDTTIVGAVWIIPYNDTCTVSDTVSSLLQINVGTDTLGAYGINIVYDDSILEYIGYEVGADGLASAVNPKPGLIQLSGFDAFGKGPGILHDFLTINWLAIGIGASLVEVDSIRELPTPLGYPIAGGTYTTFEGIIYVDDISSVEEIKTSGKRVSVLGFHHAINIQYTSREGERVKVKIYNILGQRLAILTDGISPSGEYNLTWNGESGIYFVRTEIGNKIYQDKAVILR